MKFTQSDKRRALSVLQKIGSMVKEYTIPLEVEFNQPQMTDFLRLLGIILSARTRDETTAKVLHKIALKAGSPEKILKLSKKKLLELIYPVGFYRTKAKHIRQMAGIILNKGRIPDSIEEIIKLPGVGRKTANLFLSQVYGQKRICVDTHVHRISNRLFWNKSPADAPEKTEYRLMELFNEKKWNELNSLMVKFGQNICRPIGPHCPECTVKRFCGFYRSHNV